MDNISLGVKKFSANIPYFYLFSVILGIFSLFLIILFLLVTCYQCHKNSCFKLYFPLKIFLMLSTIVSIYFTAAGLIALVTSASIGSTCKAA